MANENVGAIEYTIDANTDPLLRANKSASSSLDDLDSSLKKTATNSKNLDLKLTALSSSVKRVTTTLKNGALGAAAFISAVGAITKVAASAGLEIQKMADVSNVSVERFQELAYGASQLGISGEKLGDIFKDVQDKMGDFASTGAGELKDYFENIAPLVGQTAEEFENLSGPDALIKFKEGLDAANISASQQTFYLESLANDVAILNPLLKNGAKGFEDAAKEARELNLVLTEAEVKELVDVNKEFNTLLSTIAKVTQKVVAENGPQIREAIQKMSDLFVSAAGYADKFFKTIGGGSELSTLEAKAANLETQLMDLQKMTVKDFAINVGSDATKELLDTQSQIDELSKEYEKLQNDNLLNFVIKADRLEYVSSEIERLKESKQFLQGLAKEDFQIYVEASTQDAQEKLMMINGEIEGLRQETQAPIEVPVKVNVDVDDVSVATGSDIFDSPAFREGETFDIEDTYQVSSSGETKGDSSTSRMSLDMQEALGISKEMASELDALDMKFQDIGTTINDTLVSSAMTFGDTIGDAFANGIADGESLNDILSSIGTTIATDVLSNLISVGAQYAVNAALKSTADQTMAASGVAAVTTQAAAASVAGAEVAAANAPAAAATATWSFGSAAATGLAALAGIYATSQSLAGGRVNGGMVSAGSAYEVTENGKPEMLSVGGKDILMMGNQSGTVTSNSDLMSSGGSGGVIVNVNNNASGTEATATSSTSDGKTVIDIVVADIRKNGKSLQAITSNTTANYKA